MQKGSEDAGRFKFFLRVERLTAAPGKSEIPRHRPPRSLLLDTTGASPPFFLFTLCLGAFVVPVTGGVLSTL